MAKETGKKTKMATPANQASCCTVNVVSLLAMGLPPRVLTSGSGRLSSGPVNVCVPLATPVTTVGAVIVETITV
jgi:hypothetical protein